MDPCKLKPASDFDAAADRSRSRAPRGPPPAGAHCRNRSAKASVSDPMPAPGSRSTICRGQCVKSVAMKSATTVGVMNCPRRDRSSGSRRDVTSIREASVTRPLWFRESQGDASLICALLKACHDGRVCLMLDLRGDRPDIYPAAIMASTTPEGPPAAIEPRAARRQCALRGW